MSNNENDIFIHLNLCINKNENELIISDSDVSDYKIECDLSLTNLNMDYNELINILLSKMESILINDFTGDSSKITSENQDVQVEKIKINYASEKELLKVEGMKLIHAKKIIQLRNNNQFISNKNDLLTKVGINDFEIENIIRQVSFEKKSTINIRHIDL